VGLGGCDERLRFEPLSREAICGRVLACKPAVAGTKKAGEAACFAGLMPRASVVRRVSWLRVADAQRR